MKHHYMTCDKCSRVIEGHRGAVQTNMFNGRGEHVKTRLYDLCVECYGEVTSILNAKHPVPVQEA